MSPTDPPTPPSRRDFLRTGAAAAVTATLPAAVPGGLTPSARHPATADACIVLMLTGGPSQLDTFDPKPSAPSEVRGPFRPIRTAVPGLHLTELFPRMAAMADTFSLIRSLHHTAAPIHETGFQLLNTGHLFRDGPEWPSVGSVAHSVLRQPNRPFRIPSDPVNTGVHVSHGQGRGFLSWDSGPIDLKGGSFDENCRIAAGLVEKGASFVTVNMFTTVFDAPSWDCHADRGSLACDLGDYRDTVAPAFDVTFTALLTDLDRRGLLDRTLVVAVGEFGRTPHPNANGGRDHWPGCWTAILAGGGVKGGRVVGTSDAIASEPKDRPITPAELVATIYHALGIPPDATIPGPDGRPVRVIDAAPVTELF
jgi:uncharacterized protein (DUF1501 family)